MPRDERGRPRPRKYRRITDCLAALDAPVVTLVYAAEKWALRQS